MLLLVAIVAHLCVAISSESYYDDGATPKNVTKDWEDYATKDILGPTKPMIIKDWKDSAPVGLDYDIEAPAPEYNSEVQMNPEYMVDWHTDAATGKQYTNTMSDGHDVQAAKRACAQLNGILPEPRSEAENNFLDSMWAEQPFYLGMNDRQEEGTWRWDSDNSLVTWQYWVQWKTGTNEPDGGRFENCVSMIKYWLLRDTNTKSSAWFDQPCGEYDQSFGWHVVCERRDPADTSKTTPVWNSQALTTEDPFSTVTWQADPATDKQYAVLPLSQGFDVQSAKQTCAKINGILPEPRSEAENNFLDSLGAELFPLGMNDKEVEGTWRFDSDNSPVTWQYWVQWKWGEDDSSDGTSDNCAAMIRNKFKDENLSKTSAWFPISCGYTSFSARVSLVCEKRDQV